MTGLFEEIKTDQELTTEGISLLISALVQIKIFTIYTLFTTLCHLLRK
jgi:hypothetical protein